MSEPFKISVVLVCLALIAALAAGCFFIVRVVMMTDFYWLSLIPCVGSFALAVFLIVRILIPCIYEELKKLGKKNV